MKARRKGPVRGRASGLRQYTIQLHYKQWRLFIDDKLDRTCRPLFRTNAISWIDAKQKLGYDLSPLQEVLLAKQNREFNALVEASRAPSASPE